MIFAGSFITRRTRWGLETPTQVGTTVLANRETPSMRREPGVISYILVVNRNFWADWGIRVKFNSNDVETVCIWICGAVRGDSKRRHAVIGRLIGRQHFTNSAKNSEPTYMHGLTLSQTSQDRS